MHDDQHAEPQKRTCGARNRAGEPCRNSPSFGRRRCRFHGGHALVGASHPRFKDGRYSRYLPRDLAQRFQASLHDPSLLSLREDVSLIDARLEQLLRRVQTTESAASWEALTNAAGELKAAPPD